MRSCSKDLHWIALVPDVSYLVFWCVFCDLWLQAQIINQWIGTYRNISLYYGLPTESIPICAAPPGYRLFAGKGRWLFWLRRAYAAERRDSTWDWNISRPTHLEPQNILKILNLKHPLLRRHWTWESVTVFDHLVCIIFDHLVCIICRQNLHAIVWCWEAEIRIDTTGRPPTWQVLVELWAWAAPPSLDLTEKQRRPRHAETATALLEIGDTSWHILTLDTLWH